MSGTLVEHKCVVILAHTYVPPQFTYFNHHHERTIQLLKQDHLRLRIKQVNPESETCHRNQIWTFRKTIPIDSKTHSYSSSQKRSSQKNWCLPSQTFPRSKSTKEFLQTRRKMELAYHKKIPLETTINYITHILNVIIHY